MESYTDPQVINGYSVYMGKDGKVALIATQDNASKPICKQCMGKFILKESQLFCEACNRYTQIRL